MMMEYYSAMKSSEALAHATTWVNLENIMLGERSHKLHDSMQGNFQHKQVHWERWQSNSCLGLGEEKGDHC